MIFFCFEITEFNTCIQIKRCSFKQHFILLEFDNKNFTSQYYVDKIIAF